MAPAAHVGNNSDSKQDRQFIVIVFPVFCTLHSSTLCNRSPKHSFPPKDPPLLPICVGAPLVIWIGPFPVGGMSWSWVRTQQNAEDIQDLLPIWGPENLLNLVKRNLWRRVTVL